MSILWMDGFDNYGSGNAGAHVMLDGLWAAIPSLAESIEAPPWGARTGPWCIANQGDATSYRRVLPATKTALLVSMGYSTSELPNVDLSDKIIYFRTAANATICSLQVGTTGTLSLLAANGTVLGTTQAPVIVAATWHFLEMKLDVSAGTFELHIDDATGTDIPVLNLTGLSLPTPIAQIAVLASAGVPTNSRIYMDDLIVRDTAGGVNDTFEGDLRVAALYPNADGAAQGWTPQYRHLFGTGILDLFTSANACISCPNSASTDLGTGDWTLEGWFRVGNLPTGGNKSQLFGKWDETNNRRSFQLYMGGPTLENGNLVFRTSTDGTAGTVVEEISYPWIPDTNTWYHIAVVRASGELLLFVGGEQLGLPIANTGAYYAGVEPLGIGGQVEGTSSVTAGTTFDGWMDELRVTVGYARYTSNFTPTGPFPRGSGSDPQWADVVFLAGFNSGIADESGFARTTNARNGAAAVTPDDGNGAFQSIYHHVPQDDTFVEAALLSATGILTLSAQPANNDTVTVGTYTSGGSHAAVYRFRTVLATAFDVLLGAAVTDTLFNLRAAINLAAGSGTLYGTATIVNDDVTALGLPGAQMEVEANTAGTGGNAIASTSSLSNGGGWTGTTLSGGADIPSYSEFYFDRPPVNTTIIRGVQVVTRGFKTDSGLGSVQASFVGPLGAVDNGADNALTVTPTYRVDVFEEDPDTSGPITPATIIGGRVRLDRTA